MNKNCKIFFCCISIWNIHEDVIYFAGAIFDNNSYETELAFLTAIEYINFTEKNFAFSPVIKHVTELNSYSTQNIGK